MIDHDRLFKELISTFLLEFIELFFPEVRAYIEEGSLDFLDKEIFTDVTSGERHEVDLVAKVRFAGKDAYFLVHVENQAQPQSNFAERMFTYFARLTQKYRLPVYPIALLTYYAPLEEQPDSYILEFPDRVVLSFQFRVVQLNRLDWREFARRENPVASALMARMNIARGDRPRVKLECVRLLSTFKLTPAKDAAYYGAGRRISAIERRGGGRLSIGAWKVGLGGEGEGYGSNYVVERGSAGRGHAEGTATRAGGGETAGVIRDFAADRAAAWPNRHPRPAANQRVRRRPT
jgi:hypothetical protein